MAFVLIPASLALLLKLYFLSSPSKRSWAGSKWVAFTAVLTALNMSEVLIYVTASRGVYPDQLLKLYYACCSVGAAYAFYYVMDSSKYRLQSYAALLINICTVILVLGILFSNDIVGGYTQPNLPIVAKKGAAFWLFAVQILCVLPLVLVTLIYNALNSSDRSEQIAYVYTLKAMAALVIVSAGVMLLKLFGIEANGTGIIPLATSWFVYQTSIGKNSFLIEKDPRIFIPNSKESEAARQINWSHAQFGINDRPLKKTLKEIEIALIMQRLREHDGVKSRTAKSLGISRSTLDDKLGLMGDTKGDLESGC